MTDSTQGPAAPLVDAIADAVVQRLQQKGLAQAEIPAEELQPEEELRSRLWQMAGETRLPLSDVAEILGVSERSVRRYASGEASVPRLPLRRGPTGKVTTAGELRTWIGETERVERFRGTS